MGVAFYVCRACDNAFPNRGPEPYCSAKCAEIDSDVNHLLSLALEKLGMTRDQLAAEYKAKSQAEVVAS